MPVIFNAFIIMAMYAYDVFAPEGIKGIS